MARPPGPNVSPRGYFELPRRAFFATIIGIMLAVLLAALDQTIVGTAMPRIVADLGGFEHYSWVITSYLVASTISVPIAGKLSDLHGRKNYYLIGIVIFVVGSVLCGAATSMTQLVLFRGLQGLGAGVMQAIAFIVIGDLFPPARRGRAQGITASVFGFASVVGPTVGGYITDNYTWRWIFYINLPLGLLALTVLARFFPDIRPDRPHRGIDYRGAALLTTAVIALLLALSWGGSTYAWTSPPVIGLFAVALIATGAFVWTEAHAAEPILPLSLFRNRIVVIALATAFLAAIGMFSAILFIPLFMQGVIGVSATTSGNLLTPFMLSFVAGSVISGQLITHFGRYKVFAVGGMVAVATGMALLSTMSITTSYGAAVAYMIVLGVGLGSTMPVFTLVVQNAVPYAQLGVATATTQFFRSIGGAIGTALMGTVLTNRFVAALPRHLVEILGPEQLRLLPPQLLQSLDNPQVLFAGQEPGRPGTMAQSLAQLGPLGVALADAIVLAVRLALADAIQLTFLFGAILAAIGVVLTILLPEIPLRKTHRPEQVETFLDVPDYADTMDRPSVSAVRQARPRRVHVQGRGRRAS